MIIGSRLDHANYCASASLARDALSVQRNFMRRETPIERIFREVANRSMAPAERAIFLRKRKPKARKRQRP
jgi:hypothetical protein